MLGKFWCDKFKVVFGRDHPDPSIFWNEKQTWLAATHIKHFQEIRCQSLCSRETTNTKPEDDYILAKLREGVDETCEVSTNGIISTPSVVFCDTQVAFE
jgi:hypothetical protein